MRLVPDALRATALVQAVRPFVRAARSLGTLNALAYHRRRAVTAERAFTLRAPHARFPLHCRAGTSDLDVFEQVFINEDYMCVAGLGGRGLVVDCGAYVGYSAAYFLSVMDNARVIAIEPHPENFAMLQTNLAPYGSRARLCAAAVWSHESRLCPQETTYRDGRHWAYQIRECAASESAGLRGVTIDTILDEHAEERIALLKMDIEGAEAVVFGPSAGRWLHRVDAMVIELHDDSAFGDASRVVTEACGGQFELRPYGHVVVARRRLH